VPGLRYFFFSFFLCGWRWVFHRTLLTLTDFFPFCLSFKGYKGRKRDGFWHNLHGQSRGKGGCLVPQEQLNAWMHINGQKSCTGLSKLPMSDVEHDCRVCSICWQPNIFFPVISPKFFYCINIQLAFDQNWFILLSNPCCFFQWLACKAQKIVYVWSTWRF
jgi:hypothetical protein